MDLVFLPDRAALQVCHHVKDKQDQLVLKQAPACSNRMSEFLLKQDTQETQVV